ncbi:hypothetical protein Pmani_010279 [Petrolisthes manimaculis]|uniref:Uncharacterized protein n=1 Tax=Petrolisthes manimaculis TaxID=1843537 RepID=A0AAE1Q3F3_9EUCA|nr:hypothetical protein Pmani_010279 [Petrolisthes manimaculis]
MEHSPGFHTCRGTSDLWKGSKEEQQVALSQLGVATLAHRVPATQAHQARHHHQCPPGGRMGRVCIPDPPTVSLVEAGNYSVSDRVAPITRKQRRSEVTATNLR